MIIDFKGITKSFTQGSQRITVLEELNLQVEEAQTLAIVGESGSGKTTLLSLMAGLEQPSSGQNQVLGKDLSHLSEEEITVFSRSKYGYCLSKLLPCALFNGP